MRKFDYSFLNNGLLPARLLNLTAGITELKVMAGVRKGVYAKIFTELEAVARVQSVKSSNAIEGIVTSDDRIAAIVNGDNAPLNHNEGDVLAVLEANGLKPEKLQFELSEAQNLSSKGVENLNRLHDEYGVGLYLANFGKNYSNIDLLTEVHFDGIELDRSYAARVPEHEQACRLVVAIQHLAHTLDLRVCAKGIETQDQFEFFEELDCFKGQGYLIGEPMDMKSLTEYVGAHAVRAVS